ncbi:MAG: hypothetical protein ACRDZU_10340, partial [Acidimicrobiales bacterium]
GWALARSELAERVTLFLVGDEPIGWTGTNASGFVVAQVDPAHGRHGLRLTSPRRVRLETTQGCEASQLS